MASFRLTGIDHRPFDGLFLLSSEELAQRNLARQVATEHPGFPCRVSLEDAEVGEELLLLPYWHQPAASPYRSSGPVFVRRHARQNTLPVGVVPPYVTRRLISLRAYDAGHLMVTALVCEGPAVAQELDRRFDSDAVAYVHLHNARQGCFSCRADRAS